MGKLKKNQKELFRTKYVPGKPGSGMLFDEEFVGNTDPVECFGIPFENDEKRREYFLEKLREKLKDPEFRKIEGFPIGSDEDILALSDPPYYTACPNPFIEDFIKHDGRPYDPNIPYSREPFAADVSEGKNDSIYNAHSYHTKVPHKAIMRYILHYTEPGDVVFDGFCGTGMTGVAAQLCGDIETVESLGYKVDKDRIIYQKESGEDGKAEWKRFSRLGARKAILNDLSPAATFIAYNYNTPVDVHAFEHEAKRILKEVEEECGWMYATLARGVAGPGSRVTSQEDAIAEEWAEKIRAAKTAGEIRELLNTQHSTLSTGPSWGRINYTVWSDVFVCPECAGEVVFWEAAVDKDAGKVHKEFPCPHCNVQLTKRNMDRAWITKYDKAINKTIRQAKQVPVLINYSIGKKRFEKVPDAFDLALIDKIENADIPYWFPTNPISKGDKTGEPLRIGLTHVHHFYTKRNLWVLGAIWKRLGRKEKWLATMFLSRNLVKTNRFIINKHNPRGRINGPLTGTWYIPSEQVEQSTFLLFKEKMQLCGWNILGNPISTASAHNKALKRNSVDYIFTDPPFGANYMYSELNFLWEAWLQVETNNRPEAIINNAQCKDLPQYQHLMTDCFKEYYRVLKPGRWMTVEFHNSKNSVWNAIQEALQIAGFVIADVRTLDKVHGGIKAAFLANAVKQDLIISCYKPNGGLEERFKHEAGTIEGVWDFVRTHLNQLPVFVSKNGQAEVIAERQNYLLFDRMVAFHVQRGVTIPLSAAEFYAGLERYPQRDGMYFLPDQAAEYDKKRMSVKEISQLELFVSDEESAIQWLKQQLLKKPQTFQEIHPQFIRKIGGWYKYEKTLELSELLRENFLSYDGKGDVPSQIHSYLSTNFKELRNLEKDNPALKAKAKDRWYVPDPNKAGDLEKLRERTLMREFEEYRESKQKRLKVFRLEAVRAGFKKAWQERDYATIISVARKIPENILQEDPKLLMWYDQAITRSGEDL